MSQAENQRKLGISITESVYGASCMKSWGENEISYLKIVVLPLFK